MIYKDIVEESIEKLKILETFKDRINILEKMLLEYNQLQNSSWNEVPVSGGFAGNGIQKTLQIKLASVQLFTSMTFNTMENYNFLIKLTNYTFSKGENFCDDINELINVFQEYMNDLDIYLNSSKNHLKIPKFLQSIRKLINSYRGIINEIKRIEKYGTILENQNYNNGEILELQFCNGVNSHKEILYLLTVIPDLYKRGLDLFQLDEKEFPLEIIKIESGTFFSKLAGHPVIIGLISSALTFSANEIYNHYSPTTKVKREKEVLEVIGEKLDIIEKMEGLGMDTTNMKEDVQIYTAKLYKDTKRISKLSTKMKVNNEVFQIEKGSELLFLKDQEDFIQTLSLPSLEDMEEGTEKYTSI
ncbi:MULTISPECIES: hypothetical protein [Psychrilyobacter]|uniref:Uncharacterized protein n=1 Tax=Psychrilyobacter piezotolerans TaxID=2293438 RepID=A0ABX9KIQ6_9FUSO|nr:MULTISPECIES: hypothetical protein [Psychrilyobacter]MCS5420751.1 hypothetical protein [Psychrilyobacter sp. S5]NDI77456.1 hypothetical protein [Psychrilyobacter piezotolerans]RDE63758.1 hypothetical protein DV867_05115 [Psychrilyobacter sp. S5]REI42102.1 hypothetical protein DYH56_05115 [Psychrilyobacter piezotolerans]